MPRSLRSKVTLLTISPLAGANFGINPQVDHSVDDVLIHTDHLMYAEKRAKKKKTKSMN